MNSHWLRGVFLVTLLLSFVTTQAQEQCATDHWHQHLMQENEAYRDYFENRSITPQTGRQRSGAESTLTVPVMVWVFHNDGPENISRAQVLDALTVLNEDVRRMNSDTANTRDIFKPVAGTADIEFKLATVGPTGECTDGIVRVKTPLTVNAVNSIKNLVLADNNKYLNIYVVKSIENTFGTSGTILGYAYYPNPGQLALFDGIMIRHDVMGRIGTATSGFGITNGGRTLTHELGHYLDLQHTFDGNNCFGGDDGLSDTPPVAVSNSGCLWGNSCTNDSPDMPDQGENYMDYSNGVCQNMFSDQQVVRMHNALTGIRSNLVSSQNLDDTGVTNPGPPCVPNAYIGIRNPYACAGDSVELFDYSWNAPVLSRQWTVMNTNIPTATDSVANFHFLTAGMYTVQLDAANGQGSSSATRLINVFGSVGFVPGYYTESFEAPFPFGTSYQIQPDEAQNSWTVNYNVAKSGSQSIYLKNYTKTPGTREDLILPPLDMSSQNASVLEFTYAFARRGFDNADELRIWASINCGRTWILRRMISTNNLVTAPQQFQGEFVPSSSQWRTESVNLAAYQTIDHLLIRFEFTAGGGNNFYMDNLRIFDPLGSEETELSRVQLYPNPTHSQFVLDLGELSEVEVDIRDLTGRLMYSGYLSGRAELDASVWTAGTYLVFIRSQSSATTRKLIKQ